MTKPWDKYREIIIAEYKDQNRPLHEVQRIMAQKYGFRASTRAYRSRFDRWGIHKYSRRRRTRSMSINNGDSAGDETARPSPQPSSDIEESSSQSPSPAVVTPNELLGSDLCDTLPSVGYRSPLCVVKPDYQYGLATPSTHSVLGQSPGFPSTQFEIRLDQFCPNTAGRYSSGSVPMYRQAHEGVMVRSSDRSCDRGSIPQPGIHAGFPYSLRLL